MTAILTQSQSVVTPQPKGFGFITKTATRNSRHAPRYKRGLKKLRRWLEKIDAPHPDDASVEDINAMLYAAEEEDNAQAEDVALSTSRGFEPYSLRLKELPCSLAEDFDLARGQIFTRTGKAFVEEKAQDPVTEGYTVQSRENLALLKSEELRKNTKHAMIMQLAGLSRGILYTIAALGNQLIYRAASATGLLIRNQHGQAVVNGYKSAVYFAMARHNIWNPIGATVTAMKQFWGEVKASASRSSVKRASNWLKEQGYINFDGVFQEGIWGKGREYFDINMVKLLLLLECVEKLLGGYSALPRHRMSFVQKLYNVLFQGKGYCRDELGSDIDLSWRDRRTDAMRETWEKGEYSQYSRSTEPRVLAYEEAQRAKAEYGPLSWQAEQAQFEYEGIADGGFF